MILAQYAADWITDPANSSGVPDIYVALSLHSTTDDFAANRQRFLTEQGYRYEIVDYVPGANGSRASIAPLLDQSQPGEFPPNVLPLRRA